MTSWFVGPGSKGVADHGFDEADDAFTVQDSFKQDSFTAEDTFAPAEITAEAVSARSRQPTYEELYGSETPRHLPETAAPRVLHRPPPAFVAVAVVLGLVTGVIAARGPIVRLWPQANLIYAAAGLRVNERGLDLRHLQANLTHDGPQALLVVDGEIANRRDGKTAVPKIELVVRDAEGHEIYAWNASSPKPSSTAARPSPSGRGSPRRLLKARRFSSASPRQRDSGRNKTAFASWATQSIRLSSGSRESR